jgi:alkylresorcinol/alkylpyrone synthase
MRIASVGTAFPVHRYPQAVITQALKDRMQDKLEIPGVMNRLHSNCGVDFRHIMFPLDTLGTLSGFGQHNDLWIKGALELGQEAIWKALDHVGLEPGDISAIFFTSVTGIACPSIDARLVNLMGFPRDIKRTPIFLLGCVAGAAGISRATDYVRAFPKQYALLLSVELCSLTWQENDYSMANLVACGLFGDGAAAVVLAGEETPLAQEPTSVENPCPRVIATRSTFYPDTEHLMGWNIDHSGFNIVLSADVPDSSATNSGTPSRAFSRTTTCVWGRSAATSSIAEDRRFSKPWRVAWACLPTLCLLHGTAFVSGEISPPPPFLR